jgi:hypothetical protein
MTGSTPNRIDRLARRFAGGELRAGEGSFDRRSLLGAGALGILAFSLRGVPSARAADSEVAGFCPGGSLKACNATVERNSDNYMHALCDPMQNQKGDPFGTAIVLCYATWLSTRFNARKACRAGCPKPKRKKPANGNGGGGGSAPPGGGGHTPTCGQVDCVQGNICCKSDAGPICCAVCCSKSGGCGSSDGDCR